MKQGIIKVVDFSPLNNETYVRLSENCDLSYEGFFIGPVSFKEGDKVMFSLYENLYSRRLDQIVPIQEAEKQAYSNFIG
jgi:hypothetical protein